MPSEQEAKDALTDTAEKVAATTDQAKDAAKEAAAAAKDTVTSMAKSATEYVKDAPDKIGNTVHNLSQEARDWMPGDSNGRKNTLMIVVGVAFLACIVMWMRRKKSED